jgi:hypothetical protein
MGICFHKYGLGGRRRERDSLGGLGGKVINTGRSATEI